jgi:phospholipase C
MPQSSMPQVKNIVFLMLENRSLDNLLGWLYELPAPPGAPSHVFPRNSPNAFCGLKKGKYSNPGSIPGIPVDVTWIPDNNEYPIPVRGPFEALRQSNPFDIGWYGVMNQFFGNQQSITALPTQGTVPLMQGFFQDYTAFPNEVSPNPLSGLDILWTYTPTQAPVINQLALQYAVSDRWFCSVPSDTNPNRAYSICGTSMGRESNLRLDAVEQFDHLTIFNALAAQGQKSWGLYYHDLWAPLGNCCYTEYTFKQISQATNGEIGNISKFFQHAKAGTLPEFTYLEPKWTTVGINQNSAFITGTDYHPNATTYLSEEFLLNVYSAVRTSPQWGETLLIVTFDEHGGTYDHVGPPWGAMNPDGQNGKENGFKFDLFGARVPTILISPFVYPGTVFRASDPNRPPFDHTSFIKTLLQWAGVDVNSVDFGKRAAMAQPIEGVLANDHVNTGTVTLERPKRAVADVARSAQVHPTATEGLTALMEGIPVAITRAILRNNESLGAIQAEVARYRQDPEKFGAEIAAEIKARPEAR